MFAPTIQCDYQNLLDKIVSYVNILVELIDLKCLIVLNLYEFLSKEECEQFFYHCKCRDVAVLVLSSRKKYAFDDEQFLLIDEDLCEIVAKLHNIWYNIVIYNNMLSYYLKSDFFKFEVWGLRVLLFWILLKVPSLSNPDTASLRVLLFWILLKAIN